MAEVSKNDQEKKIDYLLLDLQELQFKINRGAEHFVPEMRRIVEEFKDNFQKVQDNPAAKNDRFIDIILFIQGVAHHYSSSLQFFPQFLIDLLDNYAEQLNPKIILKVAVCIIGLRNKNLIVPQKSLNCFFKLFRVKHKELRKVVFAHIVNDVKRQNKKHQNPGFNKQVQNMIAEILKNNADNLAKRSIQIGIQLYKSQVWTDPKIINIIANGCFNAYYKVILISCFFLIQTTEVQFVDSESEEEDFKTLMEVKGSKKTKSKEARLEKERKKHEKKLRKKALRENTKNFFPIDQVYNPQDFCEKLFAQLKKFSGKFEVKLAMLSVISRMMGRHNLLILNFYSYLLKYLTPHQRDIGKLLAYLAESVHDQLPVEELEPLVKHIIDKFIGEHCTDDKIVMGINTIREIASKQHNILDAEKLSYICDFADYKNKNVNQSSKSIINLYRDVNPKLLHKKFRGRVENDHQDKELVVGERIYTEISGASLLKQDGEYPVYMERIFDDNDFKKIKYLKKKEFEKEEEERQKELERLREVRNGVQAEQEEDYSEVSELSEYDEDDEDEEFEDEENEEDEDDEEEEEEDEEENEEDEKPAKKQPKSQIKTKSVLQKRRRSVSMSSVSDSDDPNPHGFISEGMITNFKKTKAQLRKEQLEKRQNEPKEKAYAGPKQKGGGSTNKEKLKNKNLIMLRPKKNREKIKNKQVNATLNKIKSIKNQLGHVRSGKEAARRKKAKI